MCVVCVVFVCAVDCRMMDFNEINNHHQQQQQQQQVPGTLVNVLSVSDINDNDELIRIDGQDVAWGVEAVDNGEGGMMALIGQVPNQAQEMMAVVGEIPDPAQGDIIITDVVCENYDVDAAYSDVW